MTRRFFAPCLTAAMLLAGCVGFTTESTAPVDIGRPGAWSAVAPMPTARQEVAVAVLDQRIFVIGGFGDGAEPVGTVEAYDPATNLWQTMPPLPAPTHHAAAAVIGGRLFVVGGYTGGRVSWTPQQTLYEYDPGRGSWATRAPMPTPRGGLAVAVVNSRLHAVGGSSGEATGTHEAYDSATDRWTRMVPMPTPRDHLAAVEFQGRLWAMGGRTSFVGTQYATVEIYDPASDAWSTGTALPSARGGLAAAVLGDRIFVFGGEAPLRIFSAVEMYEVAGNRWIAKEAMRTPRHGIGAAAVGGRIYVVGGATEPGYARTNANEAYTP